MKNGIGILVSKPPFTRDLKGFSTTAYSAGNRYPTEYFFLGSRPHDGPRASILTGPTLPSVFSFEGSSDPV